MKHSREQNRTKICWHWGASLTSITKEAPNEARTCRDNTAEPSTIGKTKLEYLAL